MENSREIYKSFTDMKFCRVHKNSKIPVGDAWQNNLLDYKDIEKSENFGILVGHGDYIIIDLDDETVLEEIQNMLPITFSVKSGSGKGLHLYYKCSYKDKNKIILYKNNKHIGEILISNCQVLGATSKHPTGGSYIIYNNTNINELKTEQLVEFCEKYKKSNEITLNDFISNVDFLQVRTSKILLNIIENEKIQKELAKLENIEKNNILFKNLGILYYYNSNLQKQIEQFVELCNHPLKEFEGWVKKASTMSINENELKSWIVTYNLEPIFGNQENYSGLSVFTENDVINFDEVNEHIIQNIIYKNTLNMIYAPPASFKSLFTLYLSMQISGGSFIFGREIKNCNVLYLDKENPKFTFKNRFKGLQEGTSIKTKNKLFTYMNGDILDDIFILSLKQTIKERKIGLLVFDTLHRFGSYNEDKADDINAVYTKVFQPLIQLGVTIIFLHHTTKTNKEDLSSMSKKGYRGSSDLEGMCDTVLKIERKYSEGKKENRFRLVQEKNRHGKEQDPVNIELVIDSEDDDTIISANFREYTPSPKKNSGEIMSHAIISCFDKIGDVLNSNEIKDIINIRDDDISSFKKIMLQLQFEKYIEIVKTEKRLNYYKLLKKTFEIK